MPANPDLPTRTGETVLCCSECGGRPRGFRDDPRWPVCRCPGAFSMPNVMTYPTLIPAVYDLADAPSTKEVWE